MNVLMFDCLGYEVVLSIKVLDVCSGGEGGSGKCTSLTWSMVIVFRLLVLLVFVCDGS